jgi:hypothetical protein
MPKLAQKTQQQAPKQPLKKLLMMPWTLPKALRTPWVMQRSKQPKTLLLPLVKLLTPLKKLLKPLKKKLSKLFDPFQKKGCPRTALFFGFGAAQIAFMERP